MWDYCLHTRKKKRNNQLNPNTHIVSACSCYCLLYKWSRDPSMDKDDAGRKKKKKRWWETDCDIALGKGNDLKYVSVRQKMDRQLFSKGPFIFFSLQPFNCLYLDSRESVRIFNVPMWESHHVLGRFGQNQLLVRCERTNMNSII